MTDTPYTDAVTASGGYKILLLRILAGCISICAERTMRLAEALARRTDPVRTTNQWFACWM